MVGAIAGVVGGLASAAIGAYGAAQERKAANRRREQANQQISAWQQQAERILAESEAGRTRLSDADALNRYKALRDSYDPTAFTVEPEKFDKSVYNVEDYLNPNRDAIKDNIYKQILNTSVGAGLGHSSGALEAYIDAALAKDEELYKEARAEMKDERSFDYGMYTDYINQQQKKLDSMQQGYRTQLDMLRGDIQFDQQQTDATLQNRLALGNSIAQSRAQLV
jgi:hypothetical protein